MSPWTSDFWGGGLATYAESLYPTFYGYLGQSFLTPSPARGSGSWKARSSSVGRGSGCVQAANKGTSHITSGPYPESFELMGEPAHPRMLPLLDAALSACVLCLAIAFVAARDLAVTGMQSYDPHAALAPGSGCRNTIFSPLVKSRSRCILKVLLWLCRRRPAYHSSAEP